MGPRYCMQSSRLQATHPARVLVRTVHESEQKPLKGVVLLSVALAEARLHRWEG